MALTKVAPAGIGSTPGDGYRIGSSFLHSTGVELTNANVSGIVTAAQFDGKLNIGIATFTDDVKFTGATSGRNVVWDKSENSLEFGDYTYAKFGADTDLTIWSNDTLSAINNKTGELRILSADDVKILKRNNDGTGHLGQLANFNIGGAVELFYNATKRIETSGIGATVTGQLDVGNVSSTGVITATKFVGDIAVGSSITYADNEKAYFGTGLDLQLYHDSNNSYIKDQGTGQLIIDGNAVILQYSAATKLETTSSGVDVTGTITLDAVAGANTNADLKVLFQTAAGVIDGGSSLLFNPAEDTLKVNGSKLSANQFRGSGAEVTLTNDNNSSTDYVKVTDKVELFDGGSVKLATNSGGVDITGILDVDRVDCDGLSHFAVATSTNTNYFTTWSNNNGIMMMTRGDGIFIGNNMNSSNQGSGPNNAAIKLETNGTVTATSFVGSGANLTGITGTTINNQADNRLITCTGTSNTLNGEANLTYDGSQITSTVSSHDKGLKIVSTGNHGHLIEMQSNRTAADNIIGTIGGKWDSNQVAQIRFMTGTDTTNKDEGCIAFVQRGPGGDWRRRFHVNESGKVHITGNNQTANSTDKGLLHVAQNSANEGYVTDIMDEFMAGTAFNSTSDGRATIRVEWAKGYDNNDTTEAICGLLIDGLSAYSGPSIGVCSWARAQVGNGGGINFFSRQESVYGRDYGVYGFRKRCPSAGGGEFIRGDIESNLLGVNYGMKLELKARTGTDNYAQGIWIDEQNSGATVHCMKFTRSGTEKGSIKITNSATQFNTSSDYRLKENNVPITDGIARVKQLKPYRFNWKGETDVVDGFFAHEAQTVVPESVSGTKDEVKNVYPDTADAENPTPDPIGTEPEYQQMDHSKLVPLLTAALQEAIDEIETLKTKVAALEGS